MHSSKIKSNCWIVRQTGLGKLVAEMPMDKITDQRMTIQKLARMANTTSATVSRALSGKRGVSELTKKIVGLAKKHGYVPNQLARNLQKGGSQFLGFLAADLTNFTYVSIFRKLESLCRKRRFSLIIADSEQSPELEREHVDYFLRLNVRGVFVFPVSDWKSNVSNDHLDIFLRNGIPAVALGRISRPGISTVVSEEKISSKGLIAELQKLGHTNFLLLAYAVSGNIPAKIRIESMKEAVAEIPGGVLTDVIKSLPSSDWKKLVVQAVQRRRNRPTAIVTITEHEALALYKPFAEAGVRIPEDISIAAFGSSSWISTWIEDFSLTACHVNEDAVVDAAMSLLFEKMENPSAPDKHLAIPQQIYLRNSVAKAHR